MIVAIYANHDANVTVYSEGRYRVYELERLVKERYFTLNTHFLFEYIYDTLSELILDEFGSLVFDLCITAGMADSHMDYLKTIWDIKAFKEGGHHLDHAAGGFALSGFKEALVVSYDDGGWDYGKVSYFNIYHINETIQQ